jgi:hypothetical protein
VQVSKFLLDNYSSLSRLQKITVWCRIFIVNCRMVPQDRVEGYLTVDELHKALQYWIVLVQKDAFLENILCLSKGKEVPNHSKLRCLNPFLDNEDILRVGGLLKNTPFSQDRKHLFLLPKRHRLIELVLLQKHLNGLHAGPQLMFATLQRRYWIVGGRDLVRKFVRKCVTCYRRHHVTPQQRMTNLPTPTVNPGNPFQHCGVDYAGPFALKAMVGRSKRMCKGYVTLFVCFVARAIH